MQAAGAFSGRGLRLGRNRDRAAHAAVSAGGRCGSHPNAVADRFGIFNVWEIDETGTPKQTVKD